MCNFGFLREDSPVFVDMQQGPNFEKTKLLKMKKKILTIFLGFIIPKKYGKF